MEEYRDIKSPVLQLAKRSKQLSRPGRISGQNSKASAHGLCCSRAGLAGEATVDCVLLVSVFGDQAQQAQASVKNNGLCVCLCAGAVRCHANAEMPLPEFRWT